jgi:hypothetical protein
MDLTSVYQAMLERTGGFPPGLAHFSAPGTLEQFPTPFGAAAFQVSSIPEATQLASVDQLMTIQNQLRAVELEIKNRCGEPPIKATEEGEKSGLVSSLAAPDGKILSERSKEPSAETDSAKPSDANITTGQHEGHHPPPVQQQMIDPTTQEQQAMEGFFNLLDPQVAEEMMKSIIAMQQATIASSFLHHNQQQQHPATGPAFSGSEFPLPPAAGALFLQHQQLQEQELFRQLQQNQQFSNNNGGDTATGTAAATGFSNATTTNPTNPTITNTNTNTNTNTLTTATNGLPLMVMMPPGLMPPLPHTHTTASNNAYGYLHHPYFASGHGGGGGATVTTTGLLSGGAAAAAQQQQYNQARGGPSTTNNNAPALATKPTSSSIPTIRGARAASGLCQIPGCCARLTENDFRSGHPRFQMCKIHKDALDIDIEGNLHRFCQQCGRLQVSLDFDGLKRSCRQSLERHNARRRAVRAAKRADKLTSYGSAPLPTMMPHHSHHYGGIVSSGGGDASSLAALATVTRVNAKSIGTKRSRHPGAGNFTAHGIGHKQRVEEYMELEQASKAAIAAIKAENTAMYDALAGLLSVAEAEAEKEREALDALAAIAGGASSSRATTITGSEGIDVDKSSYPEDDANNDDQGKYNKIEVKIENNKEQQEQEVEGIEKKEGSLPDTDNNTIQDRSLRR